MVLAEFFQTSTPQESKLFDPTKWRLSIKLMIEVCNGCIVGWSSGYYIGRAGKEKTGSALANPYRLHNSRNDGERARVLADYRRWLWQKIQAGDNAVMAELMQLKEQATQGDLKLLCFCKPKACHGDIVKSCLEWLISGN